ncbi:unnamed protein product [Withania somnifera]
MAAMKMKATIAVFMMVVITLMLSISSGYAADGDSCTDYCSNSCDFCNGQPAYEVCCINNCCPSFRIGILSNFLRI